MFPDFAVRSTQAELMDGAAYTPEEFDDTLADLRRVNRYLGGRSVLARHLFPMMKVVAAGEQPVRLLDIGTGSADIPEFVVEWSRSAGIKVEFAVLDYNWFAARKARERTVSYPEVVPVQADAMSLPFTEGSFHFVLASLFLHHFQTPDAARLLAGFARCASEAFIINDLRRHPIAYYSIKVLTHLFTNNHMVQHDSAVSVLRGFTAKDIAELESSSKVRMKVFRHFPYRYILIGESTCQQTI